MALKTFQLINSKNVFIATLFLVPALTCIIYLTGIQQHRSLYLNSLLSTSILSIVFIIFITTGLYNGWKLKDGMGNVFQKFTFWKKPSPSANALADFETDMLGTGGIVGFLISMVIWIVVGFFTSIVFWWIGAIVWATILLLAGILYWIFFRALRLIFQQAPKCEGNFLKSLSTAILYTLLYNCWIYAIIFAAHFYTTKS